MILSRAREDRVVGVCLDMLLEILWTLETLATEFTLVRLERNVDSDMRGDVVTLNSGSTARVPLASEI